MTRWTYRWRPSERDFLIECPEGEPVIVVRPRTAIGDSKDRAAGLVDDVVKFLNERERQIEDGDW